MNSKCWQASGWSSPSPEYTERSTVSGAIHRLVTYTGSICYGATTSDQLGRTDGSRLDTPRLRSTTVPVVYNVADSD